MKASGHGSKKKKDAFPLSFRIPAACDGVVNTRDKRQLRLLVLNIPIRLLTTAALCALVYELKKKSFAFGSLQNTIQSEKFLHFLKINKREERKASWVI